MDEPETLTGRVLSLPVNSVTDHQWGEGGLKKLHGRSEPVNASELHSARIRQRGTVIAETGLNIPLILHAVRVKPSVVEGIEDAPTQLEVLPFSDPPRFG